MTKNEAVVDSNGKSAGNRCQITNSSGTDTSANFSCQIDQSGQWSVRILGIEGESTGSYLVTVERVR